MKKFVLTVAILTVSSQSSLVNGANGWPDFDFKKASTQAADLDTTIELTIAAQNLSGFAWTSKPVCVTYIRPKNAGAWREYHWTERIEGTNNPIFASKVRIPYLLLDKLEIQFKIFNRSQASYIYCTTSMMEFRGDASCELADLLNAKKMKLPLKLTPQDTRNRGDVIVYAEKLAGKYDKVALTLKSENTESKSICGGPRHYFEIYKRIEKETDETLKNEDNYAIVYRTEAKDNGMFIPTKKEWDQVSIPLSSLCGCDNTRELKFVCLNSRTPIGEFKTTLEEMEKSKAEFQISNRKNKDGGKVFISDLQIQEVPSFSDLMAAGLQIHVTIAIDFTRRNSLPDNPKSFHYRGVHVNNIVKALRLVVTAFKDYAWNHQYDLRAFGAQEVNSGKYLHDVKLDKSENGAIGIGGCIQAYRSFLDDTGVQMGPEANIAPIMSRLAEEASKDYSLKKYRVLIVLAVGEIETDEQKTKIKTAMEKAYHRLPLSIIFVGLGDADLTNVEEMYKEKFVDYHDNFDFMSIYETDLNFENDSNSYRRTELFAKLPQQIVSYMNHMKRLNLGRRS